MQVANKSTSKSIFRKDDGKIMSEHIINEKRNTFTHHDEK